jgi:hypothetical protein
MIGFTVDTNETWKIRKQAAKLAASPQFGVGNVGVALTESRRPNWPPHRSSGLATLVLH